MHLDSSYWYVPCSVEQPPVTKIDNTQPTLFDEVDFDNSITKFTVADFLNKIQELSQKLKPSSEEIYKDLEIAKSYIKEQVFTTTSFDKIYSPKGKIPFPKDKIIIETNGLNHNSLALNNLSDDEPF
jgi:hypothetical protein